MSAGRRFFNVGLALGEQRGITLVELLLVVALVAVLSGLAFLNLASLTSRARAEAAAANLRLIRDGMLRVGVDCGGLPVWQAASGDPGLSARPTSWGDKCWRGPYLNQWPIAPGIYELDAPGGTTMAVVRVHSIPADTFQPVATQVVGVFGPSATLRYSSSTGWSAEIPISAEYQAATSTSSTGTGSTGSTGSSGSTGSTGTDTADNKDKKDNEPQGQGVGLERKRAEGDTKK